MAKIKLTIPFNKKEAAAICQGDIVIVSGIVYTARDAAHKRMTALLDAGLDLPIDIRGQVIYYAGPAPARPGAIIGPAGPTTSARMNPYAPRLLRLGLSGIIGKGQISQDVRDALIETGSLYLQAVGGAAVLIARSITSREVVAFHDLGAEAICRLTVEGMETVCI